MALRLIEMIVQKKQLEDIRNFIERYDIIEHRELKLQNDKMLMRILLEAEQTGPILNFLDKNYADKNNKVIIIAVEAALPRISEPEQVTIKTQKAERIASEELFEDVKNYAKSSRAYISMLVLATIVAAVGLHNNSVLAIIGAMVIAPMLGPIIAISLGAILGEISFLLKALLTGLAGIVLVIVLSTLIGTLVVIDPTLSEIASRTRFQHGDLAIALASGCAGALAFTTGISETLIGVMVAVSLLPPLVTFGLLFGSGYFYLSLGSLELFILNLASVNFASVLVFLVQGIYPLDWKEKPMPYKILHTILISSWIIVLFLILAFFKIEYL
ncbi:MAG: TIGR00341 family protein [Legionellaceae bacterium]|nr:TIGR00341 family protein [Legionellaceae bacterium]